MSNKLVLSFLTLIVCLPGRILGHAGNLDLNGGHYWGQSYHCHVTACEMPDTFDFRRRARDSYLPIIGNEKNSLMKMIGPMRKTLMETANRHDKKYLFLPVE